MINRIRRGRRGVRICDRHYDMGRNDAEMKSTEECTIDV
jgi:hypothetical protein